MWLQVLVLVLVLGFGRSQDASQISVNSVFMSNQSELVVRSGSALSVGCHGDGWSLRSTALRLSSVALGNSLSLSRSTPRHTGTYSCSSTNHSSAPPTSVHLYVSDPSEAFVVARSHSSAVEGEDFLVRCLPTDPDITELTVQSERSAKLPPGMEVTFDPRQGALIRQVQRSFQGSYRCSGRRHGQEVMSQPVDLWVQRKLVAPPSLSVSDRAVIRLVGEAFEVTCHSSNENHFFSVKWTHPQRQVVTDAESRAYSGSTVFMNRTLTLSSVQTSDSGLYTCTAVNEAGVATATVHLDVIERPFIRVYLQRHKNSTEIIANVSTNRALMQGEANVSVGGANSSVGGANSSVGGANSSVEGANSGVGGANSSVEGANSGVGGANSSVGGANSNVGGANVPVGGVTRMEVKEGQDLTLTLVLEAYPPIRTQRWMTPDDIINSTVYTEEHHTNGYRSKAQLFIRRVHHFDRGLYSLLFSNEFFNGNTSLLLRVHYPPTAAVTRLNDSVICSGSGFPRPSLHWTSCSGTRTRCEAGVLLESTEEQTEEEEEEGEEEGEESVQRALSLHLSPGDDITVVCEAVSHMGRSHDLLQLHEPQSLLSPLLIGSGSVALVLLLLLMLTVWKWRQKPRYEIRWKIIESCDGNNYTFIDPSQLPYNQKWEFPRDKLRLGAVLGSGAFGKVVAATALGLGSGDNGTTVAVKMLKPSALSEERDALMSELKILSHLGFHHNIVNLLGACTTGGPMLMITEYCCHGDLLNFLRAQTQHFLCGQEVLYKNTRLRSDSGISCGSEYQEMKPILSPGPGPGPEPVSDGESLSLLDLIRFSLEVAQGLDFLSSKNCIHRDVAARNVLLSERRVAKICDFGLARDIRNDDSYIVKGNARLPVKWMSPESIFHCVYTVQSDVWSYGVLLWEIFSLGQSPYPNIAVDTNFYKMIKDGRHMERPDFAPTEMYELMTCCWDLEPTLRPTFKTIGQLISRLLPSTNEIPPHHFLQATYRNIDECREEEEKLNQRDGGSVVDHEGPVRNIYQLS